jgi:hypothetical protein
MKKWLALISLAFVSTLACAQAPTPVVITDQNGNQLQVTGSQTGSHLFSPTPVVLTDQNGNVLSLASSIGANLSGTSLPGSCVANTTFTNTANGNFYTCSAGVFVLVSGGGVNNPLTSVPNGFPWQIGGDVDFAGPNPYVDLRAGFGLYTTYSTGNGIGGTATATCNGTSTVSLTTTWGTYFKTGEYATIYNCGSASTAVLPSSVTVTPGVNPGGPEILSNSNGSTSYGYKVVAEDQSNGRTAATSAVTITTGAAANGGIGCTPTGTFSVSGQTVTVPVTSGCKMVSGMQFWIFGASDATINGNWVTVAGTGSTSVVFTRPASTAYGAPTSGTISGAITCTVTNDKVVVTAAGFGEATLTCSAAPTGLLAGQVINVSGLSNGSGVYNGSWEVAAVSGSTVSYYIPASAAVGSAADSGTMTQALISGWMLNRVAWAYNSANYRYHVYGPFCGVGSGVCNWMGQTVQNFWDDQGVFNTSYGGTYTSIQPPYIPTAAPASGANQHFTGKISSGAGTTSLVFTTTAAATLSGATIVSDAGPALVAACAATVVGIGKTQVYVPPNVFSSPNFSNWVVNSDTTISCPLLISGSQITANETIHADGEGITCQGVYAGIDGVGYPLLSMSAGGVNNCNVSSSLGNGYLDYFGGGSTFVTFNNVYLGETSLSGNNDCNGLTSLLMVTPSRNTSFNMTWNGGSSYPGQCGASTVGTSMYPSNLATTNLAAGATSSSAWNVLTNVYAYNRGGFNVDSPTGSENGEGMTVNLSDGQSLAQAYLSTSGGVSYGCGGYYLSNGYLADYPSPWFTGYSPLNCLIQFTNLGGGSESMSFYTGTPLFVSTWPAWFVATGGNYFPYYPDATTVGSNYGLPVGLGWSLPTFSIGGVGDGNAVLSLLGNTSGAATITAPSVAGTSTNPFSFSNVILAPNGSASAPAFATAGCSTCGWYTSGANVYFNSGSLNFTVGGTNQLVIGTNQLYPGAANTTALGLTTNYWKGVVSTDFLHAGTTFTTNAGCSESSLTGGASAGSFKAGATSCTTTVTMGNSSTATNGWACSVWDTTTTADTLKQTAFSTTTVTFSGTVASNDIIIFSCDAF